ncbi:hypothetical protein K501DRAFT_299141 [Backusella circina FSU 941]|nr:hypothetical protein K501DRAFT_299141 [Backusella circina FSU 941]
MKLPENGRQHTIKTQKKTNRTPSSKPVSKLNDQHKTYLINYFDENSSATIKDAVEDLIKSFEGLEIKKSRVAEFMKDECNLSIKVATRHSVERNSKTTLEASAQFVKEWIQEKGMLYMQNCVFLGESGFDINMCRSRAWSTRGTQAIIEPPSARTVSHTPIIGAVSAFGVVNVSTRDPGNIKRRKVVGAKKRKARGGDGSGILKGTTAGHYLQFISDTLDIMDEFPNMKGYIPVYIPSYSRELNPIEMFWKVLWDGVRRGKLTDIETLASRITEGSEDAPVEHLQNFIQHSIDCFPECLNKKSL